MITNSINCMLCSSGAGMLDCLRPVMQDLWHGKVYVPARQLAVAGSLTYAQAYVQSLRHAAAQHITMPELCGFRWLFRYGSNAHSSRTTPWSRPSR
jgi:hypothetical protein